MSEPWYKDGLKFTCTQCGNCCTGPPGFVWVNDAEVAAIAEHRGEPVEEVLAVFTRLVSGDRTLRERDNGDCVFLGADRRCTVYPVRPRKCRTWTFWESNLKTPEDWQDTCAVCPGSGHGELIPLGEITRRKNVIRI
jgi:uncharacterized protein